MSFQRNVLIIAALALVLILGLVAYGFLHSSAEQWPPVVGDCPDYWMDKSGAGAECVNTHRLGECNLPTKDSNNAADFNKTPYTGIGGACAKYKWAEQCGVVWDGITSGVANPCDAVDSQIPY
jgi:hypothetical protein